MIDYFENSRNFWAFIGTLTYGWNPHSSSFLFFSPFLLGVMCPVLAMGAGLALNNELYWVGARVLDTNVFLAKLLFPVTLISSAFIGFLSTVFTSSATQSSILIIALYFENYILRCCRSYAALIWRLPTFKSSLTFLLLFNFSNSTNETSTSDFKLATSTSTSGQFALFANF